MLVDPYEVLRISSNATEAEIKAAYRELVKRHHPDAGGDEEQIISLNAAWELLGDPERRREYDLANQRMVSCVNESKKRGIRNARATVAASVAKAQSVEADEIRLTWFTKVYHPIDRLLGTVINPFQAQLRQLSADPYDDELMSEFCDYLEKSRKRMERVNSLYRSVPVPNSAQGFALSLYQCFSEVDDALVELDRYTMGYVDSYLHDGKEMLREAKKRRVSLQKERRSLNL